MTNGSLVVAADLDYRDAKNNLILMSGPAFNLSEDDAMIFELDGLGEGKPVFNYRAYLNQEEQPEPVNGKENKHFKYFFQCPNPKCISTEGNLKADEDGDIIIVCKTCNEPTFVK